jgi:arabinofuranosyltransferase
MRSFIARAWWALPVALLAMAAHAWAISGWMLDDAFIFFRYADNFAAGLGPVYNSGEHVEGYTSLLWVVLLALGRRLGADTVVFARVLGFVFAAATLTAVAFAHRWIVGAEARSTRLAALVLGTCGVFTAWSLTGMDVPLFTFLVTVSVLMHARLAGAPDPMQTGKHAAWRTSFGPAIFGAIGGLLVLGRPEGLLVFSVLAIDLAFRAWRRAPARTAAALGMFAAIVVPYCLWRVAYYGDPLPNTFYAKVGGTARQVENGAVYALRFLVPAALLLAPTIVALVHRRWTRSAPGGIVLPALCGAYVLGVILVGGDVMPAFRFFAPILPLLCLMAALSVQRLPRLAHFAVPLALAAAIYGIAATRFDPDIDQRIHQDPVSKAGMAVGIWLAQHVPPDAVLATNTAGTVPYYSGLRTIDMLGLCDAHIAHRKIEHLGAGLVGHEKHDGDYVLSRRPDLILFASSIGALTPAFPSDEDLYVNPTFHVLYEPQVYPVEIEGRSYPLTLYRLKGLLYP